jgi:hypothetical protein
VESLLDWDRVLDDVIVVEHRRAVHKVHIAVVTGHSIGFPQIECSARSAGSSKLWRESVLKRRFGKSRIHVRTYLTRERDGWDSKRSSARTEGLSLFCRTLLRGSRPQFGTSFIYQACESARSTFPCDEMQPGAMLFLHLFCRNNSAAKVCELHKLMLDCL